MQLGQTYVFSEQDKLSSLVDIGINSCSNSRSSNNTGVAMSSFTSRVVYNGILGPPSTMCGHSWEIFERWQGQWDTLGIMKQENKTEKKELGRGKSRKYYKSNLYEDFFWIFG